VFTIVEQFMLNLQVTISSDQTYTSLKGFHVGTLLWNTFSRVNVMYFWQDLPTLKYTALYAFIVCSQHGEVWQCKLQRIYLNSFISTMRCYVLSILLSSPSLLGHFRKTVPSGEDNNRIIV
jgi:hypothetical protein